MALDVLDGLAQGVEDQRAVGPIVAAPPIAVRVINLDASPDRWEAIHTQLEVLGIPHRRFSAVEGLTVEVEDTVTKARIPAREIPLHPNFFQVRRLYHVYCYPGDASRSAINFDYQPLSKEQRPYPSAGELGATCSHRALWYEATTTKTSMLILEDDVQFSKNFWPNTLAGYKALPARWDALFHFTLGAPSSQKPRDCGKVERYSGEVIGFQAYSVSITGAEKFLELSKRMFSEAVDVEITHKRFRSHVYRMKHYDVSTSLESSSSDIHKRGRDH